MKKIDFVFLGLIFFVFWKLWIPGPKVAVDLPYWYKDTLDTFFSAPFMWRELLANGMGESVVTTLSVYPELFIFGMFSRIGFSFTALTYLLFLIPLILLSFYSINKLLKYLGITGWGKNIGAFLYLTNTYIILLIDGGQINLAFAYGGFPLTFYLYRKCIESFNTRSISKFLFSLLLISIFDIRVVYILAFFIILDLFFDFFLSTEKIRILFKYLRFGIISLLALTGFHMFWILPAILAGSQTLPVNYGRSDQVDFLSFSSLSHNLLLLQPHFFENVFGRVTGLKAEFAAVPMLVFTSLLLKRNRWIGFFAAISIIGIFLSKGSQAPFGETYHFLFNNLPGFVLFRDPSKFFFLIALGYAVLIGFTVRGFQKKYFLPIFTLVLLIFLVRPIFLGQMTGLFSQPRFEIEYKNLANFLKEQKEFARVLWIPARPPLGFSSPNHPSVESIYLTTERPFAISAVGTYETLNFLREAPFMGEIMDVSGIGYIAYPTLDPLRADPHPDNQVYYDRFLKQLSELPWISEVVQSSKIPLLRTKKHQDRFFITKNTWFVLGSDLGIYSESTKSASLSLSRNGIIFAEQNPELGEKLVSFPDAKIVLQSKTIIDLAATFIPEHQIIFPSRNLNLNPDSTGWWKRDSGDFLKWREFLNAKYDIDTLDFDFGGGWAIAEGSLNLEITKEKIKKNSVLLARVMESRRSGTLKFSQEGIEIGEITTLVPDSNVSNIRWFEVGKITSDRSSIVIRTSGDINVINAIAILDRDQWVKYLNRAEHLKIEGKIQNFNSGEERSSPLVTYEQINPTKYHVRISGISTPGMLIFSQRFNSNWHMSGQESVPVYSWLNGFSIEKDGEYIVEIEAQKYVYPGLLISGLTLLILIGVFWRYKKK